PELPKPVPLRVVGLALIVACTCRVAPLLTVIEPVTRPRPPALCTLATPLVTVVLPVNVLAPLKTTVPTPAFVRLATPVIGPLSVRVVPAPAPMLLLLARVTAPAQVLLPPGRFSSAPPLLIPVPLRMMVLAIV